MWMLYVLVYGASFAVGIWTGPDSQTLTKAEQIAYCQAYAGSNTVMDCSYYRQ